MIMSKSCVDRIRKVLIFLFIFSFRAWIRLCILIFSRPQFFDCKHVSSGYLTFVITHSTSFSMFFNSRDKLIDQCILPHGKRHWPKQIFPLCMETVTSYLSAAELNFWLTSLRSNWFVLRTGKSVPSTETDNFRSEFKSTNPPSKNN